MLADVQTRERLNTRVRTATGTALLLLITGVAGYAMVAMNSGPTPSSYVAVASVGIAAADATNSMTVRWTAPGDDGNTGQATSYDLRYSTSAITDANWGFATAAQGEPLPKAAGQNEQLLVANLQPNTSYFFGVKTADEAGNISSLSNIPTKATAPISLPGCIENWRCEDWLACTAGTQTRVCTDQAACGTTTNKPTTSRACTTGGGGAPPQGGDTVPPNTVITAAPTGTISDPRYRFTWRGLDDVTPAGALEFSYRLDNRAWSAWNRKTEVVIRNLRNGTHTFQVRSRDAAKNIDPSPPLATFRVLLGALLGIGVERGGVPSVRLLNTSGTLVRSFTAFESTFRGGVQVQFADVGDDGFGEVVVASGPGRVAEVRLFRTDGSRITSFQPYGNAYRDGLFVTVADVNGDGPMEIITAKQKGTPNVRVFGYKGGRFTQVYREFNGEATSYKNGLSLTSGDLNNDGKAEIVTAPAGAGNRTVRVFQLQNTVVKQIAQRVNVVTGTGISVTTADLGNDGATEILVAPRSNGAPTLRAFTLQGSNLSQIRKDTPLFQANERAGIRLSSIDLNADGKDDVVASYGTIVTPKLTVLNGANFTKLKTLNVFSSKDRLVLTHDSGT